MNMQRTWSTVIFSEGEASIEATLNYLDKTFSLTHDHNDDSVTFTDDDINIAIKRAKLVMSALKYIKQELETE